MIKTPAELLYEMTGFTEGSKLKEVYIPKNWIYQLCEQYAEQYIEAGIGNPARMQANVIEVKKEMAVKLREKGFSIRQIMRALNYKSTRSITELLKK